MTLADVGEAAGYSRGLPAHCFGSKEGLLRRVAIEIGSHFDALRQAQGKRNPGMDSLRGSIEIYFATNKEGSLPSRAMLVMLSEALLEGSTLREDIVEYNRQVLKGLEGAIRAGQQKGEIRAELKPGPTALLIMGAMRGVMQQQLIMGGPAEPAKQMMLELLERMLVTP